MNRFDLFIVTRGQNTLADHAAVHSLLMELTASTDITAVYNETESLGQFQYWNITTTLDRQEVSAIAHKILNNFEGDDKYPWWAAGYHPRRVRRHRIVRVSVYDC